MDNHDIIALGHPEPDIDLHMKNYVYFGFKRFFDILFSLIATIPLLLLTIIVKLSYVFSGDFDSIFFIQERIGKDGKPFKMYKFRTMIPNADKVLLAMLSDDNSKIAKEYKKYKKLENDPRVTKAGKILRNTSLDEFPQFINVLKGEMSLVGPRPYLYREKEDMGEYFEVITQVKPGITGYWQVNGRNNTEFKQRLILDEYYCRVRGFILDSKIVIKTIAKVFIREGVK